MGAEQLTKPQRALNLRLGFIRLLYNRYSPGTLNPKPSGCLQSLRSWHEATRVLCPFVELSFSSSFWPEAAVVLRWVLHMSSSLKGGPVFGSPKSCGTLIRSTLKGTLV